MFFRWKTSTTWSAGTGASSPRTWLYRVATNACLDTLRRDARRAVRFEDGRLADIAAFEQPTMFTAFGLPARL